MDKIYPLPRKVIKWLQSLSEPQRTKEWQIADKNWTKICRFCKEKKDDGDC